MIRINVFNLCVASALGVKDTLPAFLNPSLTSQDLVTGVCFASGGSGFDDMTANVQVRTNRLLSILCVCVYVYMCVYIYIYIYIHTHIIK